MKNDINKSPNTILVCLLPFVILSILCGFYFYIFLGPSTDLQQMRRILLGSLIVVLAGFVLTLIFLKMLKRTYVTNKWLSSLFIATILIAASVVTTFQMRLPDAFRHAYASAFLSYYMSSEIALDLGNLVEWVTSYKKNQLFNSGMDYCNNHYGRQVALDIKQQYGSWRDVEQKINQAYTNGELILSKHQFVDILKCHKDFFAGEVDKIKKMQEYIDNNQ